MYLSMQLMEFHHICFAWQYMQQVARCEYDCRWDDCDKAQMEGHRLQVGCVCSALKMLATCVVRTTRAIQWASKNVIVSYTVHLTKPTLTLLQCYSHEI